MYYGYDISDKTVRLADMAEADLTDIFKKIDENALICSAKVLRAFQECKLSSSDFIEVTGYGYTDAGREKLEEIYAKIFNAEDALVRPQLMSGTHALYVTMSALLRAGETLVYISGTPYDTLQSVIGTSGDSRNSLIKWGVKYDEVALRGDDFDLDAIRERLSRGDVRVAAIQRSRGYAHRRSLTIDKIAEAIKVCREASPDTVIMVDNCYGEFTGEHEPTEYGVDLMAGSLIKNPGGGLAPTGGYVVGKAELVEKAAMRLTTPGIGGECGATLGNNRLLFQGLFMAPHIVAQALKTATFCSAMMSKIGFETSPAPNEVRSDIIQMVTLRTADNMKKFCKGIQSGAPVDSYVTPEPWQMPGYNCPVIMAEGAFIQGSSIELSADGPMKEPFIAYLQCVITYESVKLVIMMAVNEMLE